MHSAVSFVDRIVGLFGLHHKWFVEFDVLCELGSSPAVPLDIFSKWQAIPTSTLSVIKIN